MSHGFELEGHAPAAPVLPVRGALGLAGRALGFVNRSVLLLSMLALLAACAILTGSVVLRYFLHIPTDWQDEAAVFLLVGATFLCGAHVQSQRGHIGIEAVAGLLPPAVNRARQVFCDIVSTAFCAFFTWKSWTLFHEAWVDGQTTSSSWAPPLAIPYGLMSAGMTLLTLQLLLQLVMHFHREPRA
ncbi:TRAP transporter small permease [Derxia lacustris]|uniref:TRAP transporter small permease n=1 Tax=Derxia lacustris TaxID=764842 RepID=UPI000A178768|nr:TRAP transporter small permease [Derxia lacustris]